MGNVCLMNQKFSVNFFEVLYEEKQSYVIFKKTCFFPTPLRLCSLASSVNFFQLQCKFHLLAGGHPLVWH